MKNKLFVLALVLMMALPVFGLAAEITATENPTPAAEAEVPEQAAEETEQPAEETEQEAVPAEQVDLPTGRRQGRGRQAMAPQAGFTDENEDSVCDNCGKARGQNPEAPSFTDADGDGVCDHRSERAPRQGRMGGRRMRSQMPGMRGMQRGNNFVDENADGVCDHPGTAPAREGFGPGNRPMGPGRNRR